jgi:hypothetical protein
MSRSEYAGASLELFEPRRLLAFPILDKHGAWPPTVVASNLRAAAAGPTLGHQRRAGHHGDRPARQPAEGRDYYDRRKTEGKTSMEAMRALKTATVEHRLHGHARRRDHPRLGWIADGPGMATGQRL